jgi:hypothetical protein
MTDSAGSGYYSLTPVPDPIFNRILIHINYGFGRIRIKTLNRKPVRIYDGFCRIRILFLTPYPDPIFNRKPVRINYGFDRIRLQDTGANL